MEWGEAGGSLSSSFAGEGHVEWGRQRVTVQQVSTAVSLPQQFILGCFRQCKRQAAAML